MNFWNVEKFNEREIERKKGRQTATNRANDWIRWALKSLGERERERERERGREKEEERREGEREKAHSIKQKPNLNQNKTKKT